MCIVAFAWAPGSATPLLLAANRDEFFERATEPMHWWPGNQVLAGRDLKEGGAWLGVTRHGRFALITNIRNPALKRAAAPSRGAIVRHYLESTMQPSTFVAGLAEMAPGYEGFNLICGQMGAETGANAPELWFLNSVEAAPRPLPAGQYGLSNATLDTEWPKLVRLKQGFRHALAEHDVPAQDSRLLRLLRNNTPTATEQLPQTGVPPEWERALGSIFINRDGYGTRASTLLRVSGHRIAVSEINYSPDAQVLPRADFSFDVGPIVE